MSKKKLISLIRTQKKNLEKGAEKALKDTIPDDLPLPILIETFFSCLTTMVLSGKRVVPTCKSRLNWDLPESPTLLTNHRIMLAMKREIVTSLEKELDGQPHLLVEAVCELEDCLDAMLTFLLEEEEPSEQQDLIKIGEVLSKEYSDDIICIYDDNGNLLYISPSIEKIMGYTPAEWKNEGPGLMIRNPIYEVMEVESQDAASFENIKYMVVIPSKQGDEKVVEVEDKFIKGPKGEIRGLWSRMHDVSVRESLKKELENKNKQYEEIFEEAGDLIFILDGDGLLKSVNRRLRDLTGYSTEYLKGKSLESLLHEQDREKCHQALYKLTSGETVEFEARMLSAFGHYIHTSIRCNPFLTSSKQNGMIGIARDITEKIIMEEDLNKKMDLLERFRRASIDRERRIKELIQQLERTGGGERIDR